MDALQLQSQRPSDNKKSNQKVTYTEVADLANDILSQGELPSVLRIRGLLSHLTVSNNEISEHLFIWQKEQLELATTAKDSNRQQLLKAMETEQAIIQGTNELELSLALVRSTLEATTDGIMVVSKDGHLVDCNQKFIKMWGIPQELIESGDEQKALEHVMHQMIAPQEFYEMVSRTYGDLEETNEINEVLFKDGRIFELYSQPHRVHGHIVGRVWSARDVTQRRLSEEAIRIRNRAIEASPSGVLIIDITMPGKPVVYVNATYEKITEHSAENIVGKPWKLPEDTRGDNKIALEKLHITIEQLAETRIELQWHRKDGGLCWTELYVAPVPHPGNPITHYVGVLSNITDRKVLEQQLTHQATHDPLTNLPNRIMLMEHLKQTLAQAKRVKKIVGLLFIDLDQFKLVNDSLGHDWGDILLKKVGERLKSCVREEDIVARLGGDEFVIVLSFLNQESNALPVIDKIINYLRQPFLLQEGVEATVLSTPSIGVSFYPKDGSSAKNLLKNADIAMYKAKDSGRNTFQLFNANMNAQLTHRIQIEQDLHLALERKEFELYLQPVVNLLSKKITGFEALIRWQHPERGLVSPIEFIPIAEETGLIVPIGEWVLNATCNILNLWKEQELPSIPIAINVSGRQFKQPDFFARVKNIIHTSGVSPELLNFEVTESLLIDDLERVVHLLTAFRQLGIKLSIDDFGTGYSSLNYLKTFPVNKLKIDRSFVSDIVWDESNAAITQAIIAIARSLKMTVVAEGVETKEQLAFLQKLHCDEVQGFYFSRPVPLQEATAFVHQQSKEKNPFLK